MPAKPILKPLAPTPVPLKHRRLPAVTPIPDDTVPAVDPVPDDTVPATRALAKAKPAKPAITKPAPGSREAEALQITKEIKRTLKDIALGHIHAGRLLALARMRDEKLYTALGYKTLEEYAKDRFGFKSSTLYKHLKAYEWVRANRPDWLEDNPKGYIPDQRDLQDLVWMDEQLQKPKLADATRADLETLKSKAFEGQLRKKDLDAYKRHGNESNNVRKAILSSLRSVRRRAAQWNEMPPQAMQFLDQTIAILAGKL